jgi:hypothetical protein
VIRLDLTEDQARATAVVLGLVRRKMIFGAVRVVGAAPQDLRGAQAAIEDALEPEPGEFALGVNEFERRTWDPRSAA